MMRLWFSARTGSSGLWRSTDLLLLLFFFLTLCTPVCAQSRSDAVELMRKVIAVKRGNDIAAHDFYQYDKYAKLTLSLNDISPQLFEQPQYSNRRWLINQLEVCPYNNKLVLPVTVDETVSQKNYRKSPRDEKTIVLGIRSAGVNDLVQTGDMYNTLLKDIFTDINLYDDQIRLLRQQFTSPIGSDALAFYRYRIVDTTYVDLDKCYHLSFIPNNLQDFGFRGDLYVLADSSWQVRRCDMTVPRQGSVNFVTDIQIMQEYSQLPDGSWVLTVDDMFTELGVAPSMPSLVVVRNTRYTNFAFDELPGRVFRGRQKKVTDPAALMRNDSFWLQHRQVQLSSAERSIADFVRGLESGTGFGHTMFAVKTFLENYVETGTKRHPSKVDIGPVNTFFTANYIDGFRTRLSAQTTANLDSNLFLNGYVAHGWKSRNTYYKGEVTWSFNKKNYLPREYPRRTLSFLSTYDVMAPTDRFIDTDKDNVFAALKWTPVERMMFYNRQQLSFEYETLWGLKTTLSVKTERNEPAGNIEFRPFRTTELHAELRFSPGESYMNTKQRRLPVNLNAPVFTIGHTVGLKDVLGSDYPFHLTEASVYKRFWLNSWGSVDCRLKGAVQWSEVPFMLLIMPEANLSYVMSDNTFELVNCMEFLHDRYASAIVGWDLNGKLFNRLPLIRQLKWREWIAVRCMWGRLTDRNRAAMPDEYTSLNAPYWELSLGIHNIFKVFHIEYVRRLNYLDLPTAHRQGVRLKVRMKF